MVDLYKGKPKQHKRLLSMLLVLIMLFSIFAQSVNASETGIGHQSIDNQNLESMDQINIGKNSSATDSDSLYNPDDMSPNEYAEWKAALYSSDIQKNKAVSGLSSSFISNSYLRNEFIEAYIDSNGLFTMGTTGGNPNSSTDDNKKLLYGHPSPWSSITTIRIDNQNYVFNATTQSPSTSEDGKLNTSTQKINDIEIKQVLSFFQNPNTSRDDTIEIKYQITNTGTSNSDVGTRIMLDTMLGGNDGAPFKIDGIGDCTTEMEFEGNAIPQSWQAFDNLINPSVISNGTFFYNNNNKPDKVQFARWGGVKSNIWDYSITPSSSVTGDSAVAIYFNPKTLAPGETRTVTTHYGLNDFIVQDLNPPLSVGIFAPKTLSLNSTNDGYTPNPITVTAHIENTGNDTAVNSKINIVLPEELSIVGNGSTIASLGNMAPGQKKQVTWNLLVANQSSTKSISYNVIATADNAETKNLPISLSVPAVIQKEKKAIIFVPGILGSEIHASSAVGSQHYLTNQVNGFNFEDVDYPQDYKFWVPQSVTGGWGGLSDLANSKRIKTDALMILCDANGNPVVSTKAIDLNKEDKLFGTINAYGSMMTNLQTNFGHDYCVNFFAYDWRLTVSDAANKLENYINSKKYTDVILIAHSMGGLVSSNYIGKSQNNKNKVKKLITLGTPYLGSPKALYVFETGKMLGGTNDIVMAEPLKIMAPNLASAYELLPSSHYFSLNSTYYASKYEEVGGWLGFNDRKEDLTTYKDTVDMIKSRNWASGKTFVDNAQQVHDAFYNNEVHVANTVDSYFVIGYDKGTIGKVEMKYDKNGNFKSASDIESNLNGDGTVPVISANLGGNTPTERTFYIKEEHGDLAKNQDVITLVDNIIRNTSSLDSIEHSSKIIRELPTKGFFKKKLKIECPVDVYISKNGEPIESVENNDITLEKDGVTAYTVGEKNDTKIIYLNNEDVYDIALNGTDIGTMNYTVEEMGNNGETVRKLRFSNIALTAETKITSNTDIQNGLSLNIDNDGDGVVDGILHPTFDSSIKNLLNITATSGGIISTGTSDYYTSEEIINLVAVPNTGYRFTEWSTSNGGLFESASNASTYFQMPNNSSTVTANFEPIFTVTFDSQGGSSVSSINDVSSGSTISVPTSPTKVGYTFNGWYKEAFCTNAWNFGVDAVTGNITLYAKWTDSSGGRNGGGGSHTPVSTPAIVNGSVIDGATKAKISDIQATVTSDINSKVIVSMNASQSIIQKQPDGSNRPFGNLSKVAITPEAGSPVTLSTDGKIQVQNLANGTDNNYNITYDLGNEQKITLGTLEIKISSNGEVMLTTTLIDPYGSITDTSTGKILDGVNVTLYYADTVRNKSAGNIPNSVAELPNTDILKPNSNQNPQISDINGAYGFMVFPASDYYILATRNGYEDYKSPTISIEKNLMKWDFKMIQSIKGVKRLAGINRVDTALEIAKANYAKKLSNIILATADNYPDALAGSVLAYQLNAPILLVGSSDADQDKVLDYMKSNLDLTGTVYILGGTAVVSSAMESRVKASGFTNITRLGGVDRYDTSVKIVDQLGVKAGSSIVLAFGENYPDALAISSSAAGMHIPILLVPKEGLNDAIRQEITKIKPSKVYIIGGTGVISTNVESQVAQITSLDKTNIVRIGGSDRYDTALAIAQYFNTSGHSICIATGNNFPDALAGSVYAANHSAPIILVDSNLSDQVKNYLKTRKTTGATIFGGEAVINKDIELQLGQLVDIEK